MDIDSSLLFDPPGLKRMRMNEEEAENAESVPWKPKGRIHLPERVEKRPAFPPASRP